MRKRGSISSPRSSAKGKEEKGKRDAVLVCRGSVLGGGDQRKELETKASSLQRRCPEKEEKKEVEAKPLVFRTREKIKGVMRKRSFSKRARINRILEKRGDIKPPNLVNGGGRRREVVCIACKTQENGGNKGLRKERIFYPRKGHLFAKMAKC